MEALCTSMGGLKRTLDRLRFSGRAPDSDTGEAHSERGWGPGWIRICPARLSTTVKETSAAEPSLYSRVEIRLGCLVSRLITSVAVMCSPWLRDGHRLPPRRAGSASV